MRSDVMKISDSLASLRASLSVNKQEDQISALFSEIKSLKNEIRLLGGIVRSCVKRNTKVMCNQETQTDYEFTVCGAETGSSSDDSNALDANSVEKEDEEESAQSVVEEEKEDTQGITNSSRSSEAAGITNNCAKMKNFAFNKVAYMIKGVSTKVPPYVVMNRLCELKFPVVHCNRLHSSRSGRPLKHLMVMVEKRTKNIFNVNNLCGTRVTIEAFNPHVVGKPRATGNKEFVKNFKPFNSRERETLRNFEWNFFQKLFEAVLDVQVKTVRLFVFSSPVLCRPFLVLVWFAWLA